MADDIEKQKAEEAAKAEAEAKAKAEAEGKGSSQEEQTDYKALAEQNEALAKAEKARADAAEALIIKNKEMARRKEGGGEGAEAPITRKDLDDLKAALLSAKSSEESPEEKALREATANLEKIKTQNAELARALKGKTAANDNAADTHQDGQEGAGDKPKISENDAKGLKSAGYEWDSVQRVWKKKLSGGKFLYAKDIKSPTWIK